MKKNDSIKLKALSDIASIDISLEFGDILRHILQITYKAMNAYSGTIMLVDEATGELRMVSSYGLPEDYIERVYAAAEKAGVHLSSSPSGTVLRTGDIYLVPDIFKEPKDEPWYELSKQIGFSAMIYAPMKRGSKIIGLLIIYMRDAHDFTNEEIYFMKIAASQASSIVQNARMCNQLKSNIQELKDHEQHLEEKIRETHKVLFESERYLKKIFESSIDGIFVLDELGRFEFGNDAAFDIFGWQREELLGHLFMKIIPEDMKEFMLERWHEIQTGIEKPYEIRIFSKEGTIRNILVSHTQTTIKGKRKYVVVIKYISEKTRLEKELKDSEEKYRDLFENADDCMYTHDENGFFQTINKAGLFQLGCSEKEVIGTHFSKWLTQESYKKVEEQLRKHLAGEPIEQPDIIEVIKKNGEHRWGEARISLIKKGEKIIGIQGVARDITEKIILEQQLKESESKYRDLFENAQVPMYILDMKGNFIKMNKSGLDILGCKEEELNGSPLSKWLTQESFNVYQERMASRLAGRSVNTFELFEVITLNGEHRLVETNTRAIKEGTRITEIHGIAWDVTEKHRLEEKLLEYHEKLQRSYEELMEADRAKTEFVSNMTHELLTPLTSIKGFVELLDEGTMGTINPEQKKSLEIILRNSDRIIRLIKELLDLTCIENNKFVMHFKNVSLESIISKSIQDIHPQANEKQIMIVREIQPLIEIWGDDERLMQVTRNLLINAIKFTPRKGKITIKSSNENEHVKISISDTGIGIPQDKLKTIFERFYQVDGSASRKYSGVGLGLSICKNIIEKHHGSIWAESEGTGSTFHIVLPKYRLDPD
jgi:PAS domain S-box-containing protein